MYDTAGELVDSLRATPTIFERLLAETTQEQALAARGGDEGWSVVEVICHLRDVEERVLERMRLMRDELDPLIAAFDQDRWAQERNYAKADMREALATYKQLREQHVAELEALTASAWERTGQHEENWQITIRAQTQHIVSHDIAHAAQIARQL